MKRIMFAAAAVVFALADAHANGDALARRQRPGVPIGPTSGTIVLVNDTFSDSERATFAPPDSVAWFKSQTANTVTPIVPGAAQWNTISPSADMMFAYFAAAGAPVSVGIGEKLTVRLTFSFAGLTASPSAGALRFGILDSKGAGSRILADGSSTTNALWTGDTGYGLYTPFSTAGGGTPAFSLIRRTTITTNNLFTTQADWTAVATAPFAAQPFANSVDYTLTYSILRVDATNTQLSAAISGGTLGDTYTNTVVETSATPNTTFDFFAWRIPATNLFGTSITFKNLGVELQLAPPAITTQPSSQVVPAGATATFTAVASGSPTLTYQWNKDTVAIPGATGTTLTLTPAQLSDAGSYTFTATNAAGSATSDPATLLVTDPPVITTPPTSQSVTVGSPVTFMAAASGTPTPTLQWNKDGVAIPGATTDTLSIGSAQIADGGSYTVTATNIAGSATSSAASLSVTTSAPVSVVNDSFADSERDTFAPPRSVAWFKSQAADTIAPVVPGAAQWNLLGTSSDLLFAYFTAAGSPISLGVGDQLSIRLTFAFTGLGTGTQGSVRFAVADSQGLGSRVLADGTSQTAPAVWAGDTGYALFTPFSTAGGSSPAFNILRRTNLAGTSILAASGDWATIGGTGGTGAVFANATDYTMSYTIFRVDATHTQLSATITGGALPGTYSRTVTENPPALPNTTFDYFGWRVTNPVTGFASAITFKNLSVDLGLIAPSITTQPTDQSGVEDNTITLTAAASGSTPLTLQWNKNGTPIPGATSPTLTLTHVLVADSGAYTLSATNAVGSVTSNVATVTIALAPPTIRTNPISQTKQVGDTVTFLVEADGSQPFSYQWHKDTFDIPGATGQSYTKVNVQLADAGDYTVTVTNGASSALSNAATLTVTNEGVAPTITTPPASQSIILGQPVTFGVEASGSTPFTYQWAKDTVPIGGATAATYTIPVTTLGDQGSYTVTVTNDFGSAPSAAGILTIIVPAAIQSSPTSHTVNAGATVTFNVDATGTAPLTYQWRKNTLNIDGATSASLVLGTVTASAAGSYDVVVTNAGGSATSAAATLIVVDPTLTVASLSPAATGTGLAIDTPLKITFATAPSLGTAGLIRIFDVTSGSTLVDTLDLSLATNTKVIGGSVHNFYPVIVNGNVALVTPHASLTYNKTYAVRIDPGVFKTAVGVYPGIADDTTWRFTTKPAGPVAGTTSLVVAADSSGDFATVQGAVDFVPSGNTLRRFVFIRNGTYQELIRLANKPLITLHGEDRKLTQIVYANNANFNPSFRPVLTAEVGDTTIENLTIRNLTPKGGSQAETIRTNGQRNIVRDLDLYSFQDTLQLNGTAFVENCYIEGDVDFLWGNAAAYFVNTELRALFPGYLVQARNPQFQNGFVFVDSRLSGAAGLTGYWLARIDPTVFPFSQVVYVNSAMGPHVNPLGWLLNNASTSSTVQFWEYKSTNLIGDPLDVSGRAPFSRQLTDVEAAQWRDPAFVLGGWAPETWPVIQAQPTGQTASAGQNVIFAVGATGRPAPAYQWKHDNVDIPGATSAILSLPAVQAGDGGTYTVVVSNASGSVTSAPAVLTVVVTAGAPEITTSPASQTIAIGDTATFAVAATGSPVLAYQWLKNGLPIPGANAALLAFPATQLSEAGQYAVTVSNSVGSVTSVPAVLAVHATPLQASPTILSHPADVTAFEGENVSLTVVAKGVPTPTYQWFRARQVGVLAGATSSSLTFNNVKRGNAGLYRVHVSNSLGTVTSTAGRLTVLRPSGLAALTTHGIHGLDGQALSATFTIQGTPAKTVLVRVAGPALGEPSTLTDPQLFLNQGATPIAQNDDWGTATGDIAGTSAAVGAIPFAPGSKDSALIATLPGGTYTVTLGPGVGVAQIEVYEVPGGVTTSKLAAGTGHGQVHGAPQIDETFTVRGDTPTLVLLRAVGPSLSSTRSALATKGNIRDASHLSDPKLEVYSGATLVGSNDEWDAADVPTMQALFARVGASSLSLGSHDAALALTLAAGPYRVHVSGVLPADQGDAQLEVYEVSPLVIAAQPQNQTVSVGDTATFGVLATGSAPITYQWIRNGIDIGGATSATLNVTNAQPGDAGLYSVRVSNPRGSVLSASANLTLTSPTSLLPPPSRFDLEGFATMGSGTTGGGVVDPSDSEHYKVIDSTTVNPAQTLRTYLESPGPLVIELRTDVDLGPLNNQSHAPLINPLLIASRLGVIHPASDKTLFSAVGSTLLHGSLGIEAGKSNIIIRNLRFRGVWEWDDATAGAYDLQSWDLISLSGNVKNVWIDHCDFAKAYDGQADIVHGSDLVTLSWSRFTGDLGTEVVDQINYLESLYVANPGDPRISYYRALRDGGQSVSQIVTHELAQDKTSLVGNSDTLGAEDNGRLNVTYHHDAFDLVRQRTPRMRFGNAHVYNLFVDDSDSVAFPGTQTAVNSTINAAVLAENNYFLEVRTPFMFSGGGKMAQRGGAWVFGGVATPFDPTRLSPVDPNAFVWNPVLGFTWSDLTTLPYPYTLDPVDYTKDNLSQVGVIVPTSPLDEALLRSYLLATSH